MHSLALNTPHRTLRLQEWLLLLILLLLCNGVHAATAYKCMDASGAVAFQAVPCAESQHATAIDLAPSPAAAPSPHYALEHDRPSSFYRHDVHVAHAKTEMAYECRTGNGEVFYRLSHCPRSVADKSDNHRGKDATHAGTVSSHPVTRAMACSEMRRAGAVGRKGHEYDESISTYDRNLGNDPCK